MEKKSTLKGFAAGAGAYTIFGLNIIFCKDLIALAPIPPLVLFTFRAAGAAALFWLCSLFMPKEKVDPKDFPKIALASFIGFFIVQVSFLVALPVSAASDVAIISTLSPVFTMLFAALFIKEPISEKKLVGVALSLFGVIFLIMNSVRSTGGAAHTSALGFVLLFLNAISFAAYLGMFRPVIAKYSVVTFMKWVFLFSLVITLPFSFKDLLAVPYSSFPGKVYLELAYLVVMATFLAYFLIPVSQKHIRPTLVSMFSYIQPIIATTIGVICGMDTITWRKLLAVVLVFAGVAIVNNSPSSSDKKQ